MIDLPQDYKFVDAYFTNNDRTIVEVVWSDANDKLHIEIIEAKDGDKAWERLLQDNKEINIDSLHERTYRRNKRQLESFEQEVVDIAERSGLWADIFAKEEDAFVAVCKLVTMPDKDVDKELLFKVKIKLFDTEEVANCDDREIKNKIRKATNFYSLLLEYGKLRKQ